MKKIIYLLLLIQFAILKIQASPTFIHANEPNSITECDAPNPTLQAISSTTATIAWDWVGGVSTYKVELYKKNAGIYTLIHSNVTTATTYTFSPLTQGTEYQAKVYSICKDNTLSRAGIVDMKTVIQDDISFRLNGVDNPLNNFNFERCPLITKGTQICSSPIRSITLGNNQIYRLRATDALYQSNFVDLIFMYNSTSDILFLKSDMPMTVSKKVITTTINNIDPRVPPQIVTSSLNFISHVPTNRIGSFNERTILTIKNWHANGGGANNTVSFDINIANNISCQEVYCYLDNGTVTKLPSAASATDGSNLVISPNPVTNIAKMTLNMAEESRGDITIYDMMGRGVQNIQRNQTFYKGEHEITIDATTLQRGFYLLEVKTQTDRIVQKFVKE